MAVESYDYYLRLLKLQRNASEADIRMAITNELRLWTRRTNAPTLESRQEAERKIRALESAEQVLLGAEGQVIRSRIGNEPSSPAAPHMSIAAETVAGTIERVAAARGTKSQERRGTVVYRRASIFYRGIDYVLEEMIHKKYESDLDQKRCQAAQGKLALFEWTCATVANPGRAKLTTFIEGPWVADLVAFASECGIE